MINGIGKKVLMLGVGGISMSGIAQILAKNGHIVLGFDKTPTEIFDCLKANNIECYKDGEKEIDTDYDTLIYTVAINEMDERIVEAKRLGKQIITRAMALKFIMEEYECLIAISGSHGKTTTTAITANILSSIENFTAHIGGQLNESGSSLMIRGDRGCFLTEVCEYNRSFHQVFPDIGVILNTDLDHVDTYTSKDEIVDAYIKFSNNIKPDGVLIINMDDANAFEIIKKTHKNKKIITISLKNPLADYSVSEIKGNSSGVEFKIAKYGKFFHQFRFYRRGEHNLYNAVFGIVIADCMSIELEKVEQGLESFKGVKRRFQEIGKLNGARVIIDYAHHPKEIEKIIQEAKMMTKGKVFACFQPHTYTRTRYFWTEFIKALLEADSVIMYPIYAAREKPIKGVSSRRMAEDIRRMGGICYYARSFHEIITYLKYFLKPNDIVLVLGAGDIGNIRLFD